MDTGHTNEALDIQDEKGSNGHHIVHVGSEVQVFEKPIKSETADKKLDLLYGLEDTPPWYLCIILGFQHYLTMVGATIAIPLIIAPALCITQEVVKAELLGTIFFMSGLVTLLQAMVGSRLPIVQGGTFAFLTPTFAILSLPQFQCPAPGEAVAAMSSGVDNVTESSLAPGMQNLTDDPEIWKIRMNEIQGAIIGASLFEVVIGLTGVVGLLLKFIGPLAIAPTIALIGISLFQPASNFASGNWAVAIMTIVLITLFSQYLRNVSIPCCGYSKGGCRKTSFPLFKLFPVILGILVSWLICYILTVTDAIPDDAEHWGRAARTDTRGEVLMQAQWFRFPYPGQWGLPTFSVAGVFGMLAGVIAGAIESVGDYYACARLSGAPPPPVHAINRGIFVEGIGCILAGLWGTGSGTTSYSENIGAIGITKVGSRRVILWGALVMMVVGVFNKFGALFVTIPDPIIGGVFMVMFGMITAVGISNLQFVDLNSSRNLFIFGFSMFFGLSVPQWMAANSNAINTGSEIFDQIVTVLLSTSMFVGGVIGFFLDNTVPGTEEERGIKQWRATIDSSNPQEAQQALKVYNLPFFSDSINSMRCSKNFPLCPSFDPRCRKDNKEEDDEIAIGEKDVVNHNNKDTESASQDLTDEIVFKI